MKRIFIFGFKPYKGYKRNISELVVKSLKPQKKAEIKKVILPIRFKKIY